MLFREDKFRRSVGSDEHVKFEFGRSYLGNPDVELPDRICLELLLRFVTFYLRLTGYFVAQE